MIRSALPKTFARNFIFPILIAVAFLLTGATAQSDYEKLKSEAEKYFAEGSFARAHKFYKQADQIELDPASERWVDFRVADTQWRAQAATQTHDSTIDDQARDQLQSLIRDIKRKEEQGRVWAEINESLGDFWWMRKNSKNWGMGWNHYQKALDWWAGSSDLKGARERYLNMVWKASNPPWFGPHYSYGNYGSLPVNVLENALKIAVSPKEKARANYLLAMTLRYQGGQWDRSRRVEAAFEAAIKAGKDAEWMDDALYHYAEWLSSYGPARILEDGSRIQRPDYVKAVKYFRRILREFRKGETRFFNQAKQNVQNIVSPVVGVRVSNYFIPGSEIQYHFNWRNVKRLDFALYELDMTRDLDFSHNSNRDFIQNARPHSLKRIREWSRATKDDGTHMPGSGTLHLDKKLPMGAYLLTASGGGKNAQDLVLVSDAALVLKNAKNRSLVYLADAFDGSPIPKAEVKLWSYNHTRNKWRWREQTETTDKQGMAEFSIRPSDSGITQFAVAKIGDRQALVRSNSYYRSPNQNDVWKVYAYTDRPAYRPEETVHWKTTARIYDGSVYSTPSGKTLEYEIHDPRGSKIDDGEARLNDYGSFWGTVDLTKTMPLGAYQIQFWDRGKKHFVGQAPLFRLEEYKLPEFKVAVTVPEENGKKKTFLLGETALIDVQADYYFGGPVANATVEVVVYQKPFNHYWRPAQPYPWYYEDMRVRNYYYGRGQQVKREVLKTDALGKAKIKLQTPASQGQDLEYVIEARVTDSSRREIVGQGTVRVSKQRFFVYMNPAHNLYRPGDKVTVKLKTLDANGQALAAKGKVKLTRETWVEIWLDPQGKEVRGDALKKIRGERSIFPPPPAPGGQGWRHKFQGYEHEEIRTVSVKTDAEGEAEFTFTAEREGFYRASWFSRAKGEAPIASETTVWVATNATSELGYRHGGLEIIADKDTFQAGRKVPVMITVPTNDRWVWFSVEGDDLYSHRLVHVTGTVKLIELDIEEKHTPNIFLNAVMVGDAQFYQTSKQIVVPPERNFLKVKVEADREAYEPREKGTFIVTTLDHEDKPVAAEVALALVDESVFYIQEDMAGDPRKFFFGTKRGQRISTLSSLQMKSFIRWEEDDEGQLKNETRYRQGNFNGRFDDKDEVGRKLKRDAPGKSRMVAKSAGLGAAMDSIESKESVSQFALEESSNAPASVVEGEASPGSTVQVRNDFRSTMFWQGDVHTGKDGTARVEAKFPDSLTQWRATARAATTKNQFGIAQSEVRTRMPLIVRLQAPRFFVEGDETVVSAVINNNTDESLTVSPALKVSGLTVLGYLSGGKTKKGTPPALKVEAGAEARVDWRVKSDQPGEARLRVDGQSKKYADAMEKSFIVHEHGVEKFLAKSGKLREQKIAFDLTLPKERRDGSTSMTVQVSPSLAVSLLDSLPYLIDYPYGCTEQTMSRFLPAVITMNTLESMGLAPEDVAGRMFGGIEPQHADKTHSKGKKDLEKLRSMVNEGLERLYDFQHGDGGWGWWRKGDSDLFMTAYVLWGLGLAKESKIEVDGAVVARAFDFLTNKLVEEELNYDRQAWALHAVSTVHRVYDYRGVHKYQKKAFDNLWDNREKLNAYTRALLTLSAVNYGWGDKAKILARNLENGLKRFGSGSQINPDLKGNAGLGGGEVESAHWGADGIYYRWSDGGEEATAFGLMALLAVDSKNPLVEPVVNWMIQNRRGAQWSNTRDTAISVLALNKYLLKSGELSTDLEYELLVNGHTVARKKISPEDVIAAPSVYPVEPEFIKEGANRIEILKISGKGPLYFSARAKFFSLEEPVTPAGNEIFVRRQYYKLEGRPTLLKGYVYEKKPLNDGDSIVSGERVETVITVESKNNYEYLVFEDLKPAGFEAVQLRSGENLYAKELKSGAVARKFKKKRAGRKLSNRVEEPLDHTGRQRWVHQELRDRKVAMFVDKLPEGVWEIRYTLRAEVPGRFHALPVMGHAMYVPEIRANGKEIRVRVKDRQASAWGQ